jgi:hypothetical protein
VSTSYRAVLGIGGAGNGISGQLGRSLVNSAVESGAAMILTVVIAIFAAYAFARLQFRFKRTIFVSVLATLLLPAYATLIPLYRIMASLGLVNTYIAPALDATDGVWRDSGGDPWRACPGAEPLHHPGCHVWIDQVVRPLSLAGVRDGAGHAAASTIGPAYDLCMGCSRAVQGRAGQPDRADC